MSLQRRKRGCCFRLVRSVRHTGFFALFVFLSCWFFYFWSPAACRVFTEDYEIDAERGEGRIGGGAGNCESSTCSSTDPSKTETNDAKKKHLVKLK